MPCTLSDAKQEKQLIILVLENFHCDESMDTDVLLGVNSGVMLMNLTRMREHGWVSQMVSYYETYRYDITFGDQDLINIFFHFFPGVNI